MRHHLTRRRACRLGLQCAIGLLGSAVACSVVHVDNAYAQDRPNTRRQAAGRWVSEADAPSRATDNKHWNQFRGPNGQGVARAVQLPVDFGPEKNVLWKTAIDFGQSSPVIWGSRIFLTSCSSDNEDELTTVCLDREQGAVLWSNSVKARAKVRYYPLNGPASPTAAVDHQHVYVYFGTYGLICYDHQGNKRWERQMDPPASQYGMSVSPILYDQLVILVVDDDKRKSRILAIDRDTGTTVWEKPRPLFKAGWSTPMIWQQPDGDELVVLGARRLTAYNAATGEELWWAGGFSIETIGVPVTGEGLLFVSDAARGGRGETQWDAQSSWKETLADYDANDDNKIQREEMANGFRIPLRPDLEKHEAGAAYPVERERVDGWFRHLDSDKDGVISQDDWLKLMSGFAMDSQPILMAIRPGATGNVRPLHVAWEIATGIPEIPSPLCHNGRIYLLRDGGVLSCLDASSGKQSYRKRIGASGQYVASPIIAGDKLIAASRHGTVTVIQVGDELKVLAKNDFGEEILATPAVADNRIYIRTDSHLYAIGE